jgi:hypothetical protein
MNWERLKHYGEVSALAGLGSVDTGHGVVRYLTSTDLANKQLGLLSFEVGFVALTTCIMHCFLEDEENFNQEE